MIRIKVPATSANIGPGYDSVGLALNLFNEITVEKSDKTEILWDIPNPNIKLEDNYVYVAMQHTLKKYNKLDLCGKIVIKKIDIPVSRGLGSSAAAIVSGIYAANFLMDNALTTQDIIEIATELEGHPDNVVPAILGDFVISAMEEDKIVFSKINFPDDIGCNVMIPNFKLSTEKARGVLPKSYSTKDCVFNSSRLAIFVNSLINKEYDKLRFALQDKLHQPYRFSLINDSTNIFKKSIEFKALGEFISGAGPTLISVTDKKNKDFFNQMRTYLDCLNDEWELLDLSINRTGTIIEEL